MDINFVKHVKCFNYKHLLKDIIIKWQLWDCKKLIDVELVMESKRKVKEPIT